LACITKEFSTNKNMSKKVYSGSIALTKLNHVKFKSPKGADCLLIPIDLNLFEVDDKGNVYLPISLLVLAERTEKNQDGYVFKSIGPKVFKAASDEQKAKWKEKDNPDTTILGSFRHFESNQNDSSGAMAEDQVINEDDLPF
jgi:hypothetical protein